jgi:hypothetical protein
MADNKYQIIDESELEFVQRGRKSNADLELVDALRKLTKGKALALPSEKVDMTSAVEVVKTEKARISANLRSAGKLAGVKIAIRWSPSGVPQIAILSTSKK